jgi:DNA-binding transcriptional LysR family regulator
MSRRFGDMLNRVDLSRTDLNLLVLFEVVLQERHVGRAAARLNLTPSAVSHGLGRLRRLLNDPLFLRTPKGVAPTARALELSEPIADILAGVRSVVSTAEPFHPATSARRFTIGAPDGVSAVFLPPLLATLRWAAPSVDISVRQLLPAEGETLANRAWRYVFSDLEDRSLDVAVIPYGKVPARFQERNLYGEQFVIVMRDGHPFADDPTLQRFCQMQHLVVSLAGDPKGFVDEILASHGYLRRIALTVPNFMLALAIIAETDLISALPRRFVAMHGQRFGVSVLEPPLPLIDFRLHAVVPTAALMDQGVAWLFDLLGPAEQVVPRESRRLRGRNRLS